MPYKSAAQRGYFNANKGKLEKQGVDVNEWNHASKGKSLPDKAPSSPVEAMGMPSSDEHTKSDKKKPSLLKMGK